jgi:hypothetical protein
MTLEIRDAIRRRDRMVSDSGHSTATALVRVTEDLRSAKAEGKVTVHVLLLQSF